jgi:hypothetical protein
MFVFMQSLLEKSTYLWMVNTVSLAVALQAVLNFHGRLL